MIYVKQVFEPIIFTYFLIQCSVFRNINNLLDLYKYLIILCIHSVYLFLHMLDDHINIETFSDIYQSILPIYCPAPKLIVLTNDPQNHINLMFRLQVDAVKAWFFHVFFLHCPMQYMMKRLQIRNWAICLKSVKHTACKLRCSCKLMLPQIDSL